MKARIAALLGLLLFGASACAQAPASPSAGPKLIVVISVDQFSAALFNEYHALIVAVGKHHCKPRPQCAGCPLEKFEHTVEPKGD